MNNTSEDKVNLIVSENNRKERDVSDRVYAPVVVKTILYSLMGTLTGGVVLGIGNAVIKSYLKL